MMTIRWDVLVGLFALAAAPLGCGDAGGEAETDGGSGGAVDDEPRPPAGGSTSGADETSTGEEVLLEDVPVVCPERDAAPAVYEHFGTVGDETWSDGVHVVAGLLSVVGSLRVDPCVAIVMRDGARITVDDGGALQLLGEEGHPVLVTSEWSNKQRGDWGHISFAEGSVGPENIIQHAIIEFGGGGDTPTLILIEDDAEASIRDTVLTESAGYGFAAEGPVTQFEGNTVQGNAHSVWTRPDHAGRLGEGTYAPNDNEGIAISEGWVYSDQTWLAHDTHYFVSGPFGITSTVDTAHLTLAAGADLRFADDTWISVADGGGLTMDGSEGAPVTLSSAKSSASPGDWEGVFFLSESVDVQNSMEWAVVRDAGQNGEAAVWVESGASLAMRSCTIEGNANRGVVVDDGATLGAFEGNRIAGNRIGLSIAGNLVGALGPGEYGPNTQEGIFVREDRLTQDATWANLGTPYVLLESLQIGGNGYFAGLTVAAGTTLELLEMRVQVEEGGWLTLDGTPEENVLITSANTPGAPGDWRAIEFDSGSSGANNVFRHARIEFGGGGAFSGAVLLWNNPMLHLDNVVFAGSGQACDIEYVSGNGTLNASASTYVVCD